METKFDIFKLFSLYEQKLLLRQTHPVLPLFIWNYSQKVQFDNLWHVDPLLIKSRGLITDFNGVIVARCMDKFFNIEQLTSEEIPNCEFDLFSKMDGSMINLFNYHGDWLISSRGSFTSDHAILAEKVFNSKYRDIVNLNPELNYVLELIGPDNVIVCRYPENDLILLTAFNVSNGDEISIYNKTFDGFNRVKKYDGISEYLVLKQMIKDDEEGFVVLFKTGMRMKIKGENYFRLHKIITNVNKKTIWEYLKNNEDINKLKDNVPDEFFNWVDDVIKELNSQFYVYKDKAESDFNYIMLISTNKREFALEALKTGHSAVLFKMYDKKPYDDVIWKMIEPKA